MIYQICMHDTPYINDDIPDMYAYHKYVWYHVPWGAPWNLQNLLETLWNYGTPNMSESKESDDLISSVPKIPKSAECILISWYKK